MNQRWFLCEKLSYCCSLRAEKASKAKSDLQIAKFCREIRVTGWFSRKIPFVTRKKRETCLTTLFYITLSLPWLWILSIQRLTNLPNFSLTNPTIQSNLDWSPQLFKLQFFFGWKVFLSFIALIWLNYC